MDTLHARKMADWPLLMVRYMAFTIKGKTKAAPASKGSFGVASGKKSYHWILPKISLFSARMASYFSNRRPDDVNPRVWKGERHDA